VHAHSPVLFAARNPFPPGGVVEDPAGGVATGGLLGEGGVPQRLGGGRYLAESCVDSHLRLRGPPWTAVGIMSNDGG